MTNPRGGKRIPPDEQRTKEIAVYLTHDELREVKTIVAFYGQPVSAYLRDLALDEISKAKEDY